MKFRADLLSRRSLLLIAFPLFLLSATQARADEIVTRSPCPSGWAEKSRRSFTTNSGGESNHRGQTVTEYTCVKNGVRADSVAADFVVEKACHGRIGPAFVQYRTMQEQWLTKADSKTNFTENLKAVTNIHAAFFQQLKNYVVTKTSTPDNLDGLRQELKDFASTQTALFTAQKAAFEAETNFVISVQAIEDGLADVAIRLTDTKGCSKEVADGIVKIQNDIGQWQKQLSLARRTVVEGGTKRDKAFDVALTTVRADLARRYAAKTVSKLSDIVTQIDAVFAAEKFIIEVNTWYTNIVRRGYGDGYLRRYLNYEKPLAMLKSNYQQALAYEKRLATIGLSADLAATTGSQLALYKEEIRKTIADVEAKGWSHQRDRQNIVAAKIEANLALALDGCKEKLDAWKALIPGATNLEGFRLVEPAFVRVIDGCQVKR